MGSTYGAEQEIIDVLTWLFEDSCRDATWWRTNAIKSICSLRKRCANDVTKYENVRDKFDTAYKKHAPGCSPKDIRKFQ